MNSTYPTRRRSFSSSRRTTLAASVAALAAAMLTLGASDLRAAIGTWQANPADQGVPVTITVGSVAWAVNPALQEGDAVRIGAVGGLNLGTSDSYYYVVGVGSTPSGVVRFSQSPSAGTFNVNSGAELIVTKVSTWGTAGNWAGGIVPNGIDDQAVLTANANTTGIMFDRDVTLGTLTVDTTDASASGLSVFGTARNGGPVSTLTLQRSTGTPTLTLTGGKSFSFSESKITSAAPGNASAKLAVLGTQGLVIDNTNPVSPSVAVNVTAVNTTPTFAAGAVRFGFGLDWSKFSGDLTLAQGVFQPLAGGTMNNNLTSLPMNSKVVLGTGTNTARLEIVGNNAQTVIRGLESTSPNSSVVNTSTALPGSIGLVTLELGSYGLATDSFNYAGNIGNTADIATVASAGSIRLVKAGPGTQILSGVNNLNATSTNSTLLAINGGKLSLSTTGAIGTITGGQGAANIDSSIVMKNGEFELSGLGVASPRSQAFGGFLMFGNIAPNTGSPDDKQAAQSNGHSTLTVIADPAQSSTLTFGALRQRNFVNGSPTSVLAGTTMLYRGTNLGAAPGAGVATIKFTTAPITGGGNLFTVNGSGALNTAQAPVLKGALADTSPTGRGTGFATYDPVTGVRPLNTSEQTTVTSGGGYDSASTDNNIKLDLAADAAITGHRSNTLQISNNTLLPATVTNTGTDLVPAHGLLFSGSAPITLTGGAITGTANSDSEDLVIYTVNTAPGGVTIQTDVSNIGFPGGAPTSNRQGWITYAGHGDLRVTGVQTAGSTGGLVVNNTGTTTLAATLAEATTLNFNQGLVKLDTGASWTHLPRLLVAPEAKFDLNGIGSTATHNRYSDINAPVISAGLTVNPIAGEVTNSSSTTVDLLLSGAVNGAASSQATSTAFFGKITGNLNLIVDKSTFNNTTSAFAYGTQVLANANTYTGSTQIRSGTLSLARGGLLPVTTVVTLGVTDSNANSTLALGDGNGSTNGSIRQELAGLYAAPVGTGTGIAAVINNNSNVSQLTLNIGTSVENTYTGNLGIDTTSLPNGSNSNLFSLRKTGAGIFEIAGTINAYTGGTVIEGGILRVSSNAKLGQVGPLTGVAGSADAPLAPISAFANQIILNGGTLQTTTTPDFVLDAKRGIGLGPTSGSTGGTGTLWVDSGVNLSYSGIIASAGNTGTQTLIKQGTGTLSLFGTSTFTGTTQVSAGTLAGTGTLASGLTINSGGAVAPGNAGVGTLTFGGDLTLNSGGALNLELAAPGTADQLVIGGTVSASGTTTVNINAPERLCRRHLHPHHGERTDQRLELHDRHRTARRQARRLQLGRQHARGHHLRCPRAQRPRNLAPDQLRHLGQLRQRRRRRRPGCRRSAQLDRVCHRHQPHRRRHLGDHRRPQRQLPHPDLHAHRRYLPHLHRGRHQRLRHLVHGKHEQQPQHRRPKHRRPGDGRGHHLDQHRTRSPLLAPQGQPLISPRKRNPSRPVA